MRRRAAPAVASYSSEAVVISVDDPSQVYFIPVETNRVHLRFSPDSGSIDFLRSFENGAELMRRGLTDESSRSILRMPNDSIFNFAWSKDGKSLALSRGIQHRDAVILTDF